MKYATFFWIVGMVFLFVLIPVVTFDEGYVVANRYPTFVQFRNGQMMSNRAYADKATADVLGVLVLAGVFPTVLYGILMIVLLVFFLTAEEDRYPKEVPYPNAVHPPPPPPVIVPPPPPPLMHKKSRT